MALDSVLSTRAIHRRVAFEVNDIIGLRNLVAHDLGIAIVPGGFASIPADVAYVRVVNPPVLRYAVITRRGQQMSAASQTFLTMALTPVRSKAAGDDPNRARGGRLDAGV